MDGNGEHSLQARPTTRRPPLWAVGVLILLLGVGMNAFAEYPRITELSSRDILFKQLQADLQQYFRAWGRPASPAEQAAFPPLRFFSFRLDGSMDLFALAARLNVPYETLATLNGLDNPGALDSLRELLIANQPGIFTWERPESTFQEIVYSVSRNIREQPTSLKVNRGGRILAGRFYRGASFNNIERAYFLNILFRFPLPFAHLTSGYGQRDDPFTGHSEFHHGIDLAAPLGTEVYAARDGRVTVTGYDPVLGRMIIIQHEAGYQTVYGHLQKISVRLNDQVRSGMIIGAVGTSGYSTGPHLHFEIRRNGSSRNPTPLLPLPKEKGR